MTISNESWNCLKLSFLILFLLVWTSSSFAQITDSVITVEDSAVVEDVSDPESVMVKPHSPKKAALLAGLIPGAGQIYNRRYWKLPIVYAGFGGLAYAVGINAKRHRCYKNALFLQSDGDSTTMGECNGITDVNTLRTFKDRYKSNMDLSIIGLSVWWLLVMVDAVVDAHLMEWEVGDDLTLRLEPKIAIPTGRASTFTGFRLVLRL